MRRFVVILGLLVGVGWVAVSKGRQQFVDEDRDASELGLKPNKSYYAHPRGTDWFIFDPKSGKMTSFQPTGRCLSERRQDNLHRLVVTSRGKCAWYFEFNSVASRVAMN